MKNDAEDAVNKIDEMGKASDADSGGSEVKDAQDKLAHEIDDFKECEEALAKAKDKLKKIMEEKEEWDKKTAAATEAANRQYEKDKAAADAESHMSEEEAEKALEKAKKAAEEAKKARKEIEKHKQEYGDAHRRYQDELDEVETDEKAVDDAKRKLKEMRAKQIAEHSGISRATGHEGACDCSPSEKAEPETTPCPPCPVPPSEGD